MKNLSIPAELLKDYLVKYCKGKSQALTIRKLCERTGLKDRTLRLAKTEIIFEQKIIICSETRNKDGNIAGYFIPTEMEEIKNFVDETTSRIKQLSIQKAVVIKTAINTFGEQRCKQMNLFEEVA
jgi:predicted transcriptional regulator